MRKGMGPAGRKSDQDLQLPYLALDGFPVGNSMQQQSSAGVCAMVKPGLSEENRSSDSEKCTRRINFIKMKHRQSCKWRDIQRCRAARPEKPRVRQKNVSVKRALTRRH